MIIGYLFCLGIFAHAIYMRSLSGGIGNIGSYIHMWVAPLALFLVLRMNKDDVIEFKPALYDYKSGIFSWPRKAAINVIFFSGLGFYCVSHLFIFLEMVLHEPGRVSFFMMNMALVLIIPIFPIASKTRGSDAM